MSTTVKPYVWNRGKPTAEHGALIRNDRDKYVWVPIADLINISDALVDIVEKHDSKESN